MNLNYLCAMLKLLNYVQYLFFTLYMKLYWGAYGVHGCAPASRHFAFRAPTPHTVPKTAAPHTIWGGRVEML
jgi:hypothetical protein